MTDSTTYPGRRCLYHNTKRQRRQGASIFLRAGEQGFLLRGIVKSCIMNCYFYMYSQEVRR